MIVTTGEFSKDAFQYADRIMEVSRYYRVLIQREDIEGEDVEGEDIEAIKEDRTNIITIVNPIANVNLPELDTVILTHDIPEHHLKQGNRGAIKQNLDQ